MFDAKKAKIPITGYSAELFVFKKKSKLVSKRNDPLYAYFQSPLFSEEGDY